MPSTEGTENNMALTVAHWSASKMRRFNRTGLPPRSKLAWVTLRLAATQNPSPSWALAIRIVRSLPARSISLAHCENLAFTSRLTSTSGVVMCNRGPRPIVSLASVVTMPRA